MMKLFQFLKNKQDEILTNNIFTINKNCILDVDEKEPEFYLKKLASYSTWNYNYYISYKEVTGKTWIVVQLALRFIFKI